MNQSLRALVRGYLEEVARDLSKELGGHQGGLLNRQSVEGIVGGPWKLGVRTGEAKRYNVQVAVYLERGVAVFQVGEGVPAKEVARGSFSFDLGPKRAAQVIADRYSSSTYSPY